MSLSLASANVSTTSGTKSKQLRGTHEEPQRTYQKMLSAASRLKSVPQKSSLRFEELWFPWLTFGLLFGGARGSWSWRVNPALAPALNFNGILATVSCFLSTAFPDRGPKPQKHRAFATPGATIPVKTQGFARLHGFTRGLTCSRPVSLPSYLMMRLTWRCGWLDGVKTKTMTIGT